MISWLTNALVLAIVTLVLADVHASDAGALLAAAAVFGVLNTLLGSLRLIDEPLVLLFSPTAVLIGLVHTYLPFMVLPLFVALDRMDWSLVEAARDLGAGRAAVFRRVVVPQTLTVRSV